MVGFALSGTVSLATPPSPAELQMLEQGIASGGEDAHRLLATALNADHLDYSRVDAVLNGISKAKDGRERLERYREVAMVIAPSELREKIWERTAHAWAAAYVRANRDDAVRLASDRLSDSATTDIDRALYLMALRASIPPLDLEHRHRARALDYYRPYLLAASPLLQETALIVARGLWDYDSLPIVRQLTFDASSIGARMRARNLWFLFGEMGPRPDSNQSLASRLRATDGKYPYDPAELAEWRDAEERFNRGILELRDPRGERTAMPKPPTIDLRATERKAAHTNADAAAASPPLIDRREGPSAAPTLPAASTTERRPATAAESAQALPSRPKP